jgi:transposase-like protein
MMNRESVFMNKKQKEEYLSKGGVRCPYCNSDDLITMGTESYGTRMEERVECNNCKSFWTDVYILTDVLIEE